MHFSNDLLPTCVFNTSNLGIFRSFASRAGPVPRSFASQPARVFTPRPGRSYSAVSTGAVASSPRCRKSTAMLAATRAAETLTEYPCQPRGVERGAGGLPAARPFRCAQDAAPRPSEEPGNRGGIRGGRAGNRSALAHLERAFVDASGVTPKPPYGVRGAIAHT